MGQGAKPMRQEEIEARSYEVLRVDMGRTVKAVMEVAEFQGRGRVWIASDRSILVTRNGRIVRTAGFKTDLRDAISRDLEPLDGASKGKLAKAVRLTRQMEWAGKEPGSYSARVILKPVTSETIKILDQTFQTQVIEESIEVKALNWAVTNHYWLDVANGTVQRTVQLFHPSSVPLTLEILRPAA